MVKFEPIFRDYFWGRENRPYQSGFSYSHVDSLIPIPIRSFRSSMTIILVERKMS